MLCKSFAICKAKNTKIISGGLDSQLIKDSTCKGGIKLDLREEGVQFAHSYPLPQMFVSRNFHFVLSSLKLKLLTSHLKKGGLEDVTLSIYLKQ